MATLLKASAISFKLSALSITPKKTSLSMDKAVNEWLDYIADFQDRMAIAMTEGNASSNTEVKQNTFNRIVDSLQFNETVQGLQDLGKEGKVTAEMLNDPKYDVSSSVEGLDI